ncbi:MAG: oligosaccharide flippase family protein, partial [Anaerolineae bacterium]|nr:oligosaccharide flippase family protein [Anaerolineae bacterium]
MSVATRAVRATAFVLVSSYANMAMGIVYGILIARLLDPEHFGIFALAMFFFTLFDVRGKLGLEYAFVHRQPTTDALFATHFVLQVAASLATLALTTLAALVVAQLNYPAATAPLMIALASALIIEAMGISARAALEKELAFARSTIVVTSALFVSYVAALVLALTGFAYWALWGQVAVNALIGALGFWWAYRRMTRAREPSFRATPFAARNLAHTQTRFLTLLLRNLAFVVAPFMAHKGDESPTTNQRAQVSDDEHTARAAVWLIEMTRNVFDCDLARWMLRYGAVMSIGAIATALLLQFDNFLVGTFVG